MGVEAWIGHYGIFNLTSRKDGCILTTMHKATSFSDEIKQAIRASGKTAYRLAKLSGIDKSVIGRFLAGKTGMQTENLDKLAGAKAKKPKGK